MKALFDTNILIDYLSARPQARTELKRYSEKAISIITWMEVMIGAEAPLEAQTRAFLGGFELVGVTPSIADRAVALRRASKIKLPDAIIWASAQAGNLLLVTRNTKDFPPNDPGIRIPYVI